jgi:serine/threonine protein kinase
MPRCPKCGKVFGSDAFFCIEDGTRLVQEEKGGLQPGTIIDDQYIIQSLLFSGPNSITYLGKTKDKGEAVAIKVLPSQDLETRFINQLKRTLKILSVLAHPYIAKIWSYGEIDEGIYIVREFIEAESLSELLKREGALSLERSVSLAIYICEALGEAHKKGVLHLNLKPTNVLIKKEEDFIKLIDFGMGQKIELLEAEGYFFGDPIYTSPEQAQGKAPSVKSDYYALGVLLFEMITGKPPFSGSKEEVLSKHIKAPVPLPSKFRPDLNLPPTFDKIIEKILQKEPFMRYMTISHLIRELNLLKESRSPQISKTVFGIPQIVHKPSYSPPSVEKEAEEKLAKPEKKPTADRTLFGMPQLKVEKPKPKEEVKRAEESPQKEEIPKKEISPPKESIEVDAALLEDAAQKLVQSPVQEIAIKEPLIEEEPEIPSKSRRHWLFITIGLVLLFAIAIPILISLSSSKKQEISEKIEPEEGISPFRPQPKKVFPEPKSIVTKKVPPPKASTIPPEPKKPLLTKKPPLKKRRTILKEDRLEKAKKLVKQGQRYIKARRYRAAIENFKKAIELYPNLASAYGGLGQASFQQKEYLQATRYLKIATRLNPNNSYFWTLLGHAYFKQGDFYNAIEKYEKALSLNPQNKNAQRALLKAKREVSR